MPMSPLESLASSAVRTAHKVHASLIVVLTRGGSTARLVAKYRPLVSPLGHPPRPPAPSRRPPLPPLLRRSRHSPRAPARLPVRALGCVALRREGARRPAIDVRRCRC